MFVGCVRSSLSLPYAVLFLWMPMRLYHGLRSGESLISEDSALTPVFVCFPLVLTV
jgi:hypothetical protein